MPPNLDNWCPDIYKGLFIDRINDDRVEVAPCCQALPATVHTDTFDFYTNTHLQNLRQEFDQGKKPDACSRCWQAENLGHRSRRQAVIEFFESCQHNDTKVELRSLDWNATWACNYACVMCGPVSSSTWSKELGLKKKELKSMGRLYQKNNGLLKNLDLHAIEHVHFNGGEPLINKEHTEILEKLLSIDRLKNVTVSYNTNGSIMPPALLLDLWSQTKLVKLIFSIDGIGPSFEYIRWPGSWDQVQSNIITMKQTLPSNVMFGFNTTVACYNLFETKDVYEWFLTNLNSNREGDQSNFNWQFAYNFDPKFLLQECINDAILHLSNIDKLHGIVTYLQSCDPHDTSNDWTQKLDAIDSRRTTSWRKTLQVGKYYKR